MSESFFKISRFNNEEKIPLLSRLLIKAGLAKDKRRAEIIIVTVSIIFMFVAIIIFIVKTAPPRIKTVKIRAKPAVQRVQVENQARPLLETNSNTQ